MSSSTELTSYFFPYLQDFDTYVQEVDPNAYIWIQPTIEDNDLIFDGKALSTWYEEDRRRRIGVGEDGEERRGRKRVRKYYSTSGKLYKKKTVEVRDGKLGHKDRISQI
ncbi:hypothetical protein FOMG_13333 [Fusarium oxysporum f. sp. melonis 26406]|uniref:Uncharacterized protein n=1 Tax=Fusarium oxysporum f. sp. melonis 26406 TaxID=1089452 RepID=W9ZPR6_FUSOX|nr:hypothetical protein FOMG_13333 [Fusarium oxysporum f. sp. melonis 26406]KAJ9415870.1 hypothetical protein QL093DRAFT_2086932 [Fusarium oxysporum]